MGRVGDAWRTLLGRSDVQIRAHGQIARIEAEWLMVCNSIELALKDLNLATDKYRKQEDRAAKRAKASTPAEPAEIVAPPSGRAAVIARLRARRAGGVPSPLEVAGNGDTGDPGG